MSHLLSNANHTAQWYQDSYPNAEFFSHLEKAVLHSTETEGWPGYAAGAKAPNATYFPLRREIRQHFYSDRSSRALQDPTGTPVRENRDNVFQLELIAYSQKSTADSVGGLWIGNLTDTHLQDIADIMKELHIDLGLPLSLPVDSSKFEGVTGFTSSMDSVRMSSSEYDSYKGILDHMRVSGNTHWDVGGFRWSKFKPHLGGIVSATGPEKWDAADKAAYRSILKETPLLNIVQTRAAQAKDPKAPAVYTKLGDMISYIHLRTFEALKAIAADDANDLTKEQVEQLLAEAVVDVDVTVHDEVTPPPTP